MIYPEFRINHRKQKQDHKKCEAYSKWLWKLATFQKQTHVYTDPDSTYSIMADEMVIDHKRKMNKQHYLEWKKSMEKLVCETIQQRIVYQWVKKTFKGGNIELILVDRFTILLKDGLDHALISFSNDSIYLRYSDRYDFKIEKIPFKKPYR